MPSERSSSMILRAEVARAFISGREIGSMKQHMLPIHCQFWWAGWVIHLRMSASV